MLTRAASFADEPGLLSGHVLHALVADALRRAVGDADARGGEDGHIHKICDTTQELVDTIQSPGLPL